MISKASKHGLRHSTVHLRVLRYQHYLTEQYHHHDLQDCQKHGAIGKSSRDSSLRMDPSTALRILEERAGQPSIRTP